MVLIHESKKAVCSCRERQPCSVQLALDAMREQLPEDSLFAGFQREHQRLLPKLEIPMPSS